MNSPCGRRLTRGPPFCRRKQSKQNCKLRRAFLENDFWAFLHVLHPQTENRIIFKKKLCWSQPHKYNSTHNTRTHTRTPPYPKTQQQLHSKSRNGTNNREWGEKICHEHWQELTETPLKTPAPKTEAGRSQPRIISYNKIFKNSLYRGLSSLIYTWSVNINLWQRNNKNIYV